MSDSLFLGNLFFTIAKKIKLSVLMLNQYLVVLLTHYIFKFLLVTGRLETRCVLRPGRNRVRCHVSPAPNMGKQVVDELLPISSWKWIKSFCRYGLPLIYNLFFILNATNIKILLTSDIISCAASAGPSAIDERGGENSVSASISSLDLFDDVGCGLSRFF